MSYGQIMRTTNVGKSLIDIGKSFISSDSSPLGKKIIKFLKSFSKFSKQWFVDISCYLVFRWPESRWNSEYVFIPCQKYAVSKFEQHFRRRDVKFFVFYLFKYGRTILEYLFSFIPSASFRKWTWKFGFSWLGYFRIHYEKRRTSWTIEKWVHPILHSEVSFLLSYNSKNK